MGRGTRQSNRGGTSETGGGAPNEEATRSQATESMRPRKRTELRHNNGEGLAGATGREAGEVSGAADDAWREDFEARRPP